MTELEQISQPKPFSMKMDPDAKAKWLEALENGSFPQGCGALYNGMGYCCLGVFAKVQGAVFSERMEQEDNEDYDPEENPDAPEMVEVGTGEWEPLLNGRNVGDNELLDTYWATPFGISYAHQRFLSHLNDGVQLTLGHDRPFYALAAKLAEARQENASSTTFMFRRHSFAQIAAVIRDNF